MSLVKTMGGGHITAFPENGFVRISVAPHGRNSYSVVLYADDVSKVLASIAVALREATQ